MNFSLPSSPRVSAMATLASLFAHLRRGALPHAIVLLASFHAFGADLNVGVAVVDISPPVGFRKAGSYSEQISTGIHDPLFAKALVLEQGDTSAALVVCDLLSVPAELSSRARRVASETVGIPESNIIIAATHNHGSPEYWGSLRDVFHEAAIAQRGFDPHEAVDYQGQLVKACVTAISNARQSQTTAEAATVVATQEGIAFNRRYHMRDGSVRFNPGRRNPEIVRPAGPVDTELPFVLFRRQDSPQTPLASLTVFAVHTAVFGGTEFGADFPSHLQSALREELGDQFISLFAEGTAGDINHIDVSVGRQQTALDESRRIGNTLASTITKHMQFARPLKEPALSMRSETVFAPFPKVSPERFQQARSLLANQDAVPAPFLTLVRAWRDCHRYRHQLRYGDKKPLEVQALRLDRDTAIVSLPHEVFVEIGISIKAASPFRNTIVISLANDVDYYIPTRRAFEEGSYEVTTCPLSPGCGELLSQTAVKLLNELKPAD